jgi:hypothetical protein
MEFLAIKMNTQQVIGAPSNNGIHPIIMEFVGKKEEMCWPLLSS